MIFFAAFVFATAVLVVMGWAGIEAIVDAMYGTEPFEDPPVT